MDRGSAMVTRAQAKRLASVKRLLADAHARLPLQFGFVLWDGSTVPENHPREGFAVALADEGVIAALMRRPTIETLFNLWASARIDIVNGTVFDLVALRPKLRTKQIPSKVDWKKVLDVGRRFLFVSRGGPWPLESIPDDKPSSGNAAENKSNVHYHYDLSNKFYALFLDPEMGYTTAYFHNWRQDIATAQRNKFDYVCRKLRLKPGERLLDIGCGWGGLMFHAAQNYGVTAYGVTLSELQDDFIREKIGRLGLDGRVSVVLKDYAAVEGQFDKIAQLEMFEHVGYANQPTYYRAMHRLLAPDGLYLHQANTRMAKRDERRFRHKRPELRAVTKYILPGTEYDHIGMTVTNLERYGFEVHDVEDWREHLALTLKHWHDRLYANREAAAREVGDVTMRMWLVYLGAGSIAYERNTACVYQTLASKRRRGPSGLPPTRADLYR
jgi:cyclopropane-fatty-acyl-phospholipid synthase